MLFLLLFQPIFTKEISENYVKTEINENHMNKNRNQKNSDNQNSTYYHSNTNYDKLNTTIIINEIYSEDELYDCQFTNPSLPNDEEYLFVVQKKFTFENIAFNFTSSASNKIGAINIEYDGEVTIRNCSFIGCSGNNGKGNAIYISCNPQKTQKNEETSPKIFENNVFLNCGRASGYIIEITNGMNSAIFQGQIFEFQNEADACGAIFIGKTGTFSIIDSIFKGTKADGTILYKHDNIATENDYFIIESCQFENCIGLACKFDLPSTSPETVNVTSCHFKSCTSSSRSNVIETSLTSDSIVLNIENCTFFNCGNQGYVIYLEIQSCPIDYYQPIYFFDNVFEFSNHSEAAIGLYVSQENRTFLIQKCRFFQCFAEGIPPWVSSFYANKALNVIFEECHVLDGSRNNCIVFGDSVNYSIVKKSVFEYSTLGGSILATYSGNILISENKFINCEGQIASFVEKVDHFELIDNFFFNCDSRYVSFQSNQFIEVPIIIKGNLFENLAFKNTYDAFVFGYKYILNDILFENNIFKNIGGILVDLDKENLTLSFLNCSFIDCERESRNNGILIFNYRNSKTIFKDCFFERNNEIVSEILSFKTNNCPIFENCSFVNNSVPGIIKIVPNNQDAKFNQCTLINCTFSNNSCQLSSGLFVINIFFDLSIENCSFLHNLADGTTNLISIFKNTSQINNQQIIKIDKCLFLSNNCFHCLASYNKTSKFEITNCNFINNIHHQTGCCILSCSSEFLFENSTIDSQEKNFGFESYTKILNILSSNFLNTKGGINISQTIESANIENSIFSDCYISEQAAVVIISNNECFFNNNIVNFTSSKDGQSIGGMHITSHGNIIITNNKFTRIRKTKSCGIYIKDYSSNKPENTVVFNYNTIEEVGNVPYGVFYIEKSYDFNFDCNIIKNCRISGLSCQIYLSNNFFTLTNLTLSGCESNGNTGGGFGLWLVFESNGIREGIFTMQDCLFENNTSKSSSGGAFAIGGTSTGRTELIINNCSFIGNYADENGGALSISSTLPALIHNCTFIDNLSKLSGGAIFIDPFKLGTGILGILPKVTISKSIFISNKESNMNYHDCGHAISFKYEDYAETVLIITDECQFIDNCNYDHYGASIKVSPKVFLFENSTILFTDKNLSIIGLNIGLVQNIAIRSSYFSNNGNSFDSISLNGYGDIVIVCGVDILITNCTFYNSSSNSGAIYYCENINTYENGLLTLDNCFFDECYGCFQFDGPNFVNRTAIVRNCTFNNCSYFANNRWTTIYMYNQIISPIIEQCIFHNCGHEKQEYVIEIGISSFIESPNTFTMVDNLFIFDDFNESCGSIYLSLSEFYKVYIHNCTFYNSSRNEDHYYNPNCIYVDYIYSLEISDCHFFGGTIIEYDDYYNHYDKYDDDAFVISLRSYMMIDVLIINCTFDSTPGAIYAYNKCIKVIGNEFKNTSKETIYIEGEYGIYDAEIIKNHFYELHRGIMIYYYQDSKNYTNPIIKENLFEKITTPLIYGFTYDPLHAFHFVCYSDDPITFENNTFREYDTQYGGFGAFIHQIEHQIKLIFINCYFVDNSQPDNGGAAFRGDHNYNGGNCSVTFDSCYFNRNNGRGYGGCLHILHELLDVIIKNCIFIDNAVDNYSYDSGIGGVIYVKAVHELTINDCIFEGNHAPECQVIYCEDTILPLSITNCKFIDNVNDQTFNYYLVNPQYSFILLTNKINIKDCVFLCTREIFSYPFLFKSVDDVSDVSFVNITCNYTSLLYVPDQVSNYHFSFNFSYIFDSFSFINCTAKNFIVESNHKYFEFRNSLFQFPEDDDMKSGGIKIDIFSCIYIINNTFINAKSANGTIYSDNIYYTTNDNNVTIENCTFKRCSSMCFCIHSIYSNYANYYLRKCTFNQCTDITEKCIICVDKETYEIKFLIDECNFINCLGFKNGNLIKVDLIDESSSTNPISIINTIFQFDTVNEACCAILVRNIGKEMFIQNCSFKNCIMSNNDSPLTNSIVAHGLRNLVVSECFFDHCGNENGQNVGNVISITGNTGSIIKNCTFILTSTAILSNSINISIIGNTFLNIIGNIIQINKNFGTRGFELIDNIFLDCNKGNIIKATINYESIIKGNIFKNVIIHQANNDDEKYVFYIINEESLPINFDNNSFINISTYYGGFGGFINSFVDSSFEINFVDCNFLNNTQNVNGGALQTTQNFNDGNINLTFKNCLFKNNVANGNGGALCISTKNDVIIECCSFISNNATNANGGAVFISNQENSTSKFQLIRNCTFISNFAIDGFAIYIEGYNYEAKIDISGNNFTNNYNLETSGCIINIESCIISQKKIMDENLFANKVDGDDYFGVIVYSCQDPVEPPFEDSSIEIIQSSDEEVSDDLSLSESISSNEISSESVSLSDVQSDDGISSSSDGYFSNIEESDSSLFNEEQTENETASEEFSSMSEQTESTIEESSSMNEQTESTIEESSSMSEQTEFTIEESSSMSEQTESAIEESSSMSEQTESAIEESSSMNEQTESTIEESSMSEQTESAIEESSSMNEQTESTIGESSTSEEGKFSPSFKPDDEKDSSSDIDQDVSLTMSSMFVYITNSFGENDNGITDRNGGGISKGALIGIICGVAAAIVVAVVATVLVVMRKKKMNHLNPKESQSSILEDTETRLQKDNSKSIKDDDSDLDLDFWL